MSEEVLAPEAPIEAPVEAPVAQPEAEEVV